MTAAVFRATPSLSVPQTQNTAPVIEFNCLYTHDVRRKQKRWQDGFLRYHTFNKRVMVYDVPRNFLGDHHWTEGGELQEGDELNLDKGGVMVQVAEEVGRTETDISELRAQKRDRSSPAKPISSSPMSSRAPRTVQRVQGNTSSQIKHKSLNTLLGSARGQIGRAALPTRSPFELKNQEQENADWQSSRKTKRQKTDPWTVEVTTKTPKPSLSGADQTNTAVRQKSPKANAKKATRNSDRSQRTLDTHQVIELSSDTEEPINGDCSRAHSISPFQPTSPQHGRPQDSMSLLAKKAMHEASSTGRDMSAGSPSVQHAQRRLDLALGERPARPSSRTSDRASLPRSTDGDTSRKETKSIQPAEPQKSPWFSTEGDLQKRGKSLKLVGSAPRKMLVFQGQPSRGPSQGAETVRDKPQQRGRARVGMAPEPTRHSKVIPQAEPNQETETRTSQHLRLQERLARIEKREGQRKHSPSQTHKMPLEQWHQPVAEDVEMGESNPAVLSKDDNVTAETPISTKTPPVPHVQPSPQANDGLMKPPQSRPFGSRNKAKQGPSYNSAAAADPLTNTLLAKPFEPPSVKVAATTRTTTRNGVSNGQTDTQPQKQDLGPWSAEAFDLMNWRPPDRNADGRKIDKAT